MVIHNEWLMVTILLLIIMLYIQSDRGFLFSVFIIKKFWPCYTIITDKVLFAN